MSAGCLRRAQISEVVAAYCAGVGTKLYLCSKFQAAVRDKLNNRKYQRVRVFHRQARRISCFRQARG